MNEFKKLGIYDKLLKAINDKGFNKPTFIQEKTIPLVLDGNDVVGKSATGSGKTLAFGAGLIQRLNKGEGVTGLVLTPTRELAEQVCTALSEFSYYKHLNIVPIYGGVSINPQIVKLKRADIVVATPGRLLDHLDRRTIVLSNVKMLVLDEADRMLDMGFIDDVKQIMSKTPKKRQTVLFSATIDREIKSITKNYMNNPIIVTANDHVDPTKLKQVYYNVKESAKFSLLVNLLKKDKIDSIIVFCNTRRKVDFVAKNLRDNGIKSAPIHGGFTQNKRTNSLEMFTNKKTPVLVCTDVAARGLDIQGVSHVYNYDLPADPKDYVHRIGRTARAGKEGKVINLLSPRDHDNFSNIVNTHEKLNIPKKEIPKLEKVEVTEEKRDRRGNSRGGFRRGGSGSFGKNNKITRRNNSQGNRRRKPESVNRRTGKPKR